MATATQLDRLEKDWTKMAGEEVKVQQTGGAYYALGSELTCLRLFHKYHHCGDRAKASYSKDRKAWYFRLEV